MSPLIPVHYQEVDSIPLEFQLALCLALPTNVQWKKFSAHLSLGFKNFPFIPLGSQPPWCKEAGWVTDSREPMQREAFGDGRPSWMFQPQLNSQLHTACMSIFS